ncbi:MAG: ABC transporter permease [Fibrobacteres bacterium]|nr:ABC transporter permease [Fibrobacterota bacterium]
MSPWRLAWADFSRRRGPASLSVAALSLAIALSGMLFRLAKVAEARFAGLARAGDVIIGAKAGEVAIVLGCLNAEGPYPGFIPDRLYFSLRNHEKLSASGGAPERPFHKVIVPMLYGGRFHGRPIIGTNADVLKLSGPGFTFGLNQGNWSSDSGQAVLGERIAREADLKVGDTFLAAPWPESGNADASGGADDASIKADGWVIPYPLKVSGILGHMGNSWDAAVFTNLPEARRLLARGGLLANSVWGSDVLNYMLIETLPGRTEALRDLVDKRTVAQFVKVDEGLATLRSLTASGRAMGGAAAILSLLLSAFCLLGLSIGSLEEKIRHFSMLRAMGYTGRELRAMALWQGLLPAALGCVGGAVLDACLFPFLRGYLRSALPSRADVPSYLWESGPVWLAFAGMAVAAALLPYWLFRRRSAQAAIQGLS